LIPGDQEEGNGSNDEISYYDEDIGEDDSDEEEDESYYSDEEEGDEIDFMANQVPRGDELGGRRAMDVLSMNNLSVDMFNMNND
jgi:hypothetical protein